MSDHIDAYLDRLREVSPPPPLLRKLPKRCRR
jgi:hypothetical protein